MGLLTKNDYVLLTKVEAETSRFALAQTNSEWLYTDGDKRVYLLPGHYETLTIDSTEYTVAKPEDIVVEVTDAD